MTVYHFPSTSDETAKWTTCHCPSFKEEEFDGDSRPSPPPSPPIPTRNKTRWPTHRCPFLMQTRSGGDSVPFEKKANGPHVVVTSLTQNHSDGDSVQGTPYSITYVSRAAHNETEQYLNHWRHVLNRHTTTETRVAYGNSTWHAINITGYILNSTNETSSKFGPV